MENGIRANGSNGRDGRRKFPNPIQAKQNAQTKQKSGKKNPEPAQHDFVMPLRWWLTRAAHTHKHTHTKRMLRTLIASFKWSVFISFLFSPPPSSPSCCTLCRVKKNQNKTDAMIACSASKWTREAAVGQSRRAI